MPGPWPRRAQPVVRVGPELQVNAYTTLSQYRATVAAHDGGFIVVWQSGLQDGSGWGVFGRRYAPDGTPLGPEFAVNTFTTGHQDQPVVAAATDSSFVVAWTSAGQDGAQQGVFGRRFDAAGAALGAEFQVNTYTASSQMEPALAFGGTDGFVVVWRSLLQDGSGWGVFGQRYDPTALAVGPEFRVNSHTTASQYEPSVTADDAGGFVVVWSSYGQDGEDLGVFGQRFDPTGSPLGPEFRVNSFTGSFQSEPAVSGDGSGAFVVVWSGPGPLGSYDVFAQRYDAAGAPVGGEFTINSYTTYAQFEPAIASDSTGAFVVAWTSTAFQDGNDDGVFAQAFDASGAALGPELQVNTYTTSVQAFPSIAAGPAGRFVVAWSSAGQDGDGGGAFAQRLGPDLIFADGFESGSLAAWSASATGGGNLAASASAALAGTTIGLQGVVTDTAGLFVQDDSPDGESRYRARFYFDPNGFDPGEAQGRFRTRVFIAFEENPTRRLLALVLRRVAGGLQPDAVARGSTTRRQADTAFVGISDDEHFVEVDWRRATGPAASDGSLQMWIDGVSVAQLTGLDNRRQRGRLRAPGRPQRQGGRRGHALLGRVRVAPGERHRSLTRA